MAKQKYEKGEKYRTTRKIGGERRQVKIIVTGKGKDRKEKVSVFDDERKSKGTPKPKNKRLVGEDSKKRSVRVLGQCQMCGKEVKNMTKTNRFGQIIPLYKEFNGNYYHNSKTKRCWEKYDRSRHKSIETKIGGELSTSPKVYIENTLRN